MGNFDRRKLVTAASAGGLGLLGSMVASAQGLGQAVRGNVGANIVGSQNQPVQAENPDILVPPASDHGDMPNLKWSFADSSMRLEDGGWARQTTVKELPVSTEIAGVNMRLKAGAIRELHWHKAAEWSYMLKGSARVTIVDQDGRNYISDVSEGDLWFFPSGLPHSIQGLGPDGCEFLLVFNDGTFSENNTFLLSDWFRHTPKEVLAKNFQTQASDFNNVPQELYIYQSTLPPALAQDQVTSPAGTTPKPFTFSLTGVQPKRFPGGTVRIADQRNFAMTSMAAALVEVEPGAMREMHWHPTVDEWQYYISGQGRMSVFGASGNARTFDYQAGDVGYVPFAMGHYIENTGTETLRFLEIFKYPVYEDVSLRQWLAVVPPALVKSHLHVPDALVAGLPKDKVLVVGS